MRRRATAACARRGAGASAPPSNGATISARGPGARARASAAGREPRLHCSSADHAAWPGNPAQRSALAR
eukprot:5663355-Alexandrium_andersonii.AAC.1